ncbi:MAG: DEAD/DEAH box helicase family protein, partial [Lentisphaeria bacterium]|nr:DEAD/DEAH box helicase family protein [Lentisphaeria bacterium]
MFELVSEYKAAGDQPQAIRELVHGLHEGRRYQTLLGVTGSGKTFTLANVLARVNRPALVLSHNKTLAAQLYSEFKSFLPNNAVEYFISYYDYYLPESYIPQTDTYIAKDASINENIERLRLSATASLLERRDVMAVASVSCIYGLTAREDYEDMCIPLNVGMTLDRDDLLRKLVEVQFERNDTAPERGQFRVRGDCVEIYLAQKEEYVRVEFWGDSVDSISRCELLTGRVKSRPDHVMIFPARHFVMPQERINAAMDGILAEMRTQVRMFESQGKLVEAQRLYQRVNYDVEMMREIGYCAGIENYSRHLGGRAPGSRPFCLLDFFPKDYIMIIDESHVTIPQLQAMYKADRNRKQTLVDHGFRLPSALDNRPLKFEEFQSLLGDVIFVSATPGKYELELSEGQVVE